MIFPSWTNRRAMKKSEKASARLRYLINRIAAELGPINSLKSVGDEIGVNYSTILSYIDRGSFSRATADKLEERFDVPAEWLLDPMSIDDTSGTSLTQEFLEATV